MHMESKSFFLHGNYKQARNIILLLGDVFTCKPQTPNPKPQTLHGNHKQATTSKRDTSIFKP